jgi:hypothetical protein
MSLLLGQLLTNVLPTLLDKILPESPEKAAAAKLEMLKMAQQGDFKQIEADLQMALAQTDINKEEAKSESLFKSGWRPATGWSCVFGFSYQILFRPIFGWVAQNLWGWSMPPSLEMDTLMTLLFGLLGLGAYRTVEKIKGAS